MSLAVDTTKRNKKYVITYTVVGIACFVMFIVSILRYVYLNVLEPVPIFFYAMLVWILLLRCKPTYDVSVERKYLSTISGAKPRFLKSLTVKLPLFSAISPS